MPQSNPILGRVRVNLSVGRVGVIVGIVVWVRRVPGLGQVPCVRFCLFFLADKTLTLRGSRLLPPGLYLVLFVVWILHEFHVFTFSHPLPRRFVFIGLRLSSSSGSSSIVSRKASPVVQQFIRVLL